MTPLVAGGFENLPVVGVCDHDLGADNGGALRIENRAVQRRGGRDLGEKQAGANEEPSEDPFHWVSPLKQIGGNEQSAARQFALCGTRCCGYWNEITTATRAIQEIKSKISTNIICRYYRKNR